MSQAKDELVARAQDPNAELETLHQLAQNYPGLRPYIAANPRTYPALLEWLGTLGDPAVDAALASRDSQPQSAPGGETTASCGDDCADCADGADWGWLLREARAASTAGSPRVPNHSRRAG